MAGYNPGGEILPFLSAAPGFAIFYYTGATGFGAARWQVYEVTAISRLKTTSFVRSGSTVTLQASGAQQGWSYALQYSEDAGATAWATVSSLGPVALSGPIQMSAPTSPGKSGFYRIAAQAP